MQNISESVHCQNCNSNLGFLENSVCKFYKTKVLHSNKLSVFDLVEEAVRFKQLLERVNEVAKDIQVNQVLIKLLNWNYGVYYKNNYSKAMQVLFKKVDQSNSILPQEDAETLLSSLKQHNSEYPHNKRKFRDWKLSFILTP